MRILVVGLGTLGSAVARAGWLRGHKLVTASAHQVSASRKLDITRPGEVRRFFYASSRFDLVINCAAISNVDQCEREPEAARAVNALGVRHLAVECTRTGAALCHISTDYVFDGAGRRPLREEDPAGPRSIYGLTKLEAEHYALTLAERSVVVRTTWIFGGARRDFVNGMIERVREGRPFEVVADQKASPAYADDLAGSFELLARRLERLRGPYRRVVHIANGGWTTRHAMAVEIARVLGQKVRIRRTSAAAFGSWAAVRPSYTVLNCDLFENEFGGRLRPWREALGEYVRKRASGGMP